jgi:methylated-DNA-[protein]-cysteine S-methyltransferase
MKTLKQKVLELTRKIPEGKITTYKIIAQKLKCNAYRAVGNALNKNKTPVIIPCHRVVNNDGRIGGYSAGVHKKNLLLKKEGIIVKNNKIINFKNKLYKF